MAIKFWIKGALIILTVSFSIIFTAQYLKSDNFSYSAYQASFWSIISTLIYLLVLWNKLRKNPVCAVKHVKD